MRPQQTPERVHQRNFGWDQSGCDPGVLNFPGDGSFALVKSGEMDLACSNLIHRDDKVGSHSVAGVSIPIWRDLGLGVGRKKLVPVRS